MIRLEGEAWPPSRRVRNNVGLAPNDSGTLPIESIGRMDQVSP